MAHCRVTAMHAPDQWSDRVRSRLKTFGPSTVVRSRWSPQPSKNSLSALRELWSDPTDVMQTVPPGIGTPPSPITNQSI